MSITGRTPTLVENSSTQTITGSLPSDRVTGDLCVAFFAMDGTTGWSAPSGWTTILAPTATAGGESLAIYYRFDPPSAPTASHTSGNGRATCIVQAYGGVLSATPIDVSASSTTVAAQTSVNAPSVTIATANAMLISAYLFDSSSRAPVTPGGMTTVKNYNAASTGRGLGTAQEVRASTGATGTRNWTFTPSGTNLDQIGASFALRPGNQFTVTGSVTSTGTLTKRTTKNAFTGSSTAVGVLIKLKVVPKTFTASVTATGVLAKKIFKNHVSSSTPVGANPKVMLHAPFTASVTGVGTFRKAPVRVFTASITAASTFVSTALGRVFGRPGVITTVAKKAGEVVLRIRRS